MPTPFSSNDSVIIKAHIPVFAPYRIEAVAEETVWEPTSVDKVFVVGSSTTYTIGDGTLYLEIDPGVAVGIIPGLTFKFSSAVNVGVMK